MEIHPYYHSWKKRALDILLSLTLFVILSPLLVLISVFILFSTGWPIIFSQKRWGKDKRVFNLFKFRTMYVGAEKNQWRYLKDSEAPAPMYKNWSDPRFVGIGKWLAKSGLDELPQLINILLGQMSFVGPRPLPVKESEKLNKSWEFRYRVKPGIFSVWSLSPERNESLKKWQELEKAGLRTGSLGEDLKIIFLTILKTLF